MSEVSENRPRMPDPREWALIEGERILGINTPLVSQQLEETDGMPRTTALALVQPYSSENDSTQPLKGLLDPVNQAMRDNLFYGFDVHLGGLVFDTRNRGDDTVQTLEYPARGGSFFRQTTISTMVGGELMPRSTSISFHTNQKSIIHEPPE